MKEKLYDLKQKHLKKHISQTQFIAYGFFLIIMTQVLSLTNNVVFSGITNDDNPEIRIDTSELIDREYVIVLL